MKPNNTNIATFFACDYCTDDIKYNMPFIVEIGDMFYLDDFPLGLEDDEPYKCVNVLYGCNKEGGLYQRVILSKR